MNRTETNFHFEIIRDEKVLVRGTKILSELSWSHELMTFPTLDMTLPIEYSEYIKGREEIKIFVNGKCFWGIIIDVNLNKAEETMDITVNHAVFEWTYRQISVNHAIKDGKLNVVYKGDKVAKANGEAITASDFSMTAENFNDASMEKLIEAAHAKAWNPTNGDVVKITKVTDVGKATTTTNVSGVAYSTSGTGKAKGLSSKVKSYRKLITKYAKKYGIPQYVELLLAIMQQESGGSGGDPMQASEGAGNTKYSHNPNSITDPEYSIAAGVREFRSCLKKAKCKGPTDDAGIHLALQGYNYGPGYITWALKHYGKWTQANANEFSDNHGGSYGDKQYCNHVLRYYSYNPKSSDSNSLIAKGEKVIEYAKQFVGTPYVWSGESLTGGCDCSGFVMKVYEHFGISLPHQSQQMLSHGVEVSRKNAMPGDLIIYPGHVALYMGRGKRIHQTPPRLKIDSNPWGAHVNGIRRVLTGTNGKGWGDLSAVPIVTQSSTEASEYEVTFYTDKGTKITVTCNIVDDADSGTVTDPSIIDNIGDIYHDYNFAYPGWEIDFQDDSEDRMIDYVYSRQNKLEAFTKTMELTPDLFWRVGFTAEKKIEVGKFGKHKKYILSLKPSGKTNIRILTEPTVDYNFENVANVATVYSEKSDSGMSSMTLREVYNDPDLQDENFPVVILRANSNPERDYTKYVTQYPKLAPNNELEFAVIDTVSVALESGHLTETTFAFNDLAPFSLDGKKVSDKDRVKAAKTAYAAAIRKLKDLRRSYEYPLTCEELPADINVGDKVRLLYDNDLWKLTECSNYYKKILQMDDWFYVQSITYNIDKNGLETNDIVLTKYIHIDREEGVYV